MLPPLDGSVSVLPGFLDFRVQHSPEAPCYVFTDPNPSSTDICSVSYLEFAQATHRIANIFRPGRIGPDGAVVAIVINTDTLFYHALTVGLIRAGLTPFPMSPRNAAVAIASMCQKTDCHRIISQPTSASLTDETRDFLPSGYSLEVNMLPEFQDIFPNLGSARDPAAFAPSVYPYSFSPPPEVIMYIHSSGSTGLPKPIPQTRTSVTSFCSAPVLLMTHERGLKWGVMASPPFHSMGIFVQLYSPFLNGVPAAIFPPQAPALPIMPTPENTLDAIRRTRCTATLGAPAFLEDWVQDEDTVKLLASLELLAFGGGPLSTASGNKLVAAGVNVQSTYGTTEIGPVTMVTFPDRTPGADAHSDNTTKTLQDWEWIQISPRVVPRWIPQGDGTYELQILTTSIHIPNMENLDDVRGYATSDICEQHPTKPFLWRFVGRKDDVIVLSSGEKTVPIPQEGHIGAHPRVAGAVMFGRGRLQVGILVEPHPAYVVAPGDTDALVAFRNVIWSQVEEANHIAPVFSRIFKEMILVSDPARPLPRAAKGTAIRNAALRLYGEDINALLSATFLRNRIMGALRDSHDPAAKAAVHHVQPNLVYAYPTVHALAAAIVRLVNPDDAFASRSSVDNIKEMIAKYTAKLPTPLATIAEKRDPRAVVLLTGSTGALGSHILVDLLSDERIARVYALNRGQDLAERQQAVFQEARLPTALLEGDKLVQLSGDLSREDFGLETSVLDDIRSSVTHIIHNAWRVDFNLSLGSFEAQIEGAVRLVGFVPGARFLFTSSVSVASNWDVASGPVPEAPLADAAIAVGLGYAESKFVVEEVLAAARRAGIEATTLRVGQISGTVASGAWNTTDWVPSLIKSSISLQCLPSLAGAVSWLPSDAVSRAVVDVMFGSTTPATVNVVHPHPTSWDKIASALNEALGVKLPSVPLEVWVKKLEHAAEGANCVDQIVWLQPAIKLVEFFKNIAWVEKERRGNTIEAGGMALFATTQLQNASPTLAKLPRVNDEHVKAWIGYWRRKQFIQ
ncbi:hypothetical protein B0H21DRAFT_811720 [Amylocystis lapponica]|nr:hypothetical protein B0H21DRAFT_811720 [Amylocystis lapponica]